MSRYLNIYHLSRLTLTASQHKKSVFIRYFSIYVISRRERKLLETRQKKLDEKELNLWRAFTEHGMRPQIYEFLTGECEEERQRLKSLSPQLELEKSDCIENLDSALKVISEIAERIAKYTPDQQRAILLQVI